MRKWKPYSFGYNEIVLRGVLIAEPNPVITEGRKPFIAARIAVPGRNRKFGSVYFNLKIYGKSAEDFSQTMHRDDVVALRGTFRSEAYIDKKTGKPRVNNYVLVYEWEQCPVDAYMRKAIGKLNKIISGGEDEEGATFEDADAWDGEW